MEFVFVLALIGSVSSAMSNECAIAHVFNEKNTRIFGVPLTLVGLIGFAILAITSLLAASYPIMVLVTNTLIAGAGIFTLYLIYWAIQIRMFCPVCFVIWAIVAVMNLAVFI